MTNSDDIAAIRTRFLDTWDNAVPVVLDNEPPIAEPRTIWARFSVQPGASRRMSIAQRTYEQLGRAYLQIFVPPGQADGLALALADQFTANFVDWSSADYRIRFDTAERRSSDAPDYYMILVSIPYRAQH